MLLAHGERRAGTYAKERFKTGARAWRRRVLRTSQVALVLAAVATVAGGYLVHGNAKIMFGFVAGAFAASLIALRDLVPPHVEMWRRGWEGERRTGRVLRCLQRDGWDVVHDIELSDGPGPSNIDHVVVGEAGVFLLDTKWYTGVGSLVDGELRSTFPDDVDERPRTHRLGPRMRAAAADLRDRIRETTGERLWVHAVVVLWSPFAQGVATYENVTYVHGSRLASWLRTMTPREQFPREAVVGTLRALGSER